VRLQGSSLPKRPNVNVYTIAAKPNIMASLESPNIFRPVSKSMDYAGTFSVSMNPYSVAMIEIHEE
jgi:hypothetical protein